MFPFYNFDKNHLCRRINNERSKQQRMIKIGNAIDKVDVDMVAKCNDKYGTFIHDKVVPHSAAWFDPSVLRSAPSLE